jgi:hypothetical protein
MLQGLTGAATLANPGARCNVLDAVPHQNVRITIDGRTIHVTRRIAGEAAFDDAHLDDGAGV